MSTSSRFREATPPVGTRSTRRRMAENGDRSSRHEVLDALRAASRLIVVTHEHPDGDALGSLIAMQEILLALGKDSLAFVAERDLPLPPEYRFLPVPDLTAAP